MHSSLGNVQAWALDPSFINMRLTRPAPEDGNAEDGKFRWDLVAPMEANFGVVMIAAFACMQSPTLDQDWEHMFTGDHAKAAFPSGAPAAYKQLHKSLTKLENDIVTRNETREFTCDDFLPSHCTLSIAG